MGTDLFSFRPDVPDPSKIVNIDLFLDLYELFWYIYRLIRHVKKQNERILYYKIGQYN